MSYDFSNKIESIISSEYIKHIRQINNNSNILQIIRTSVMNSGEECNKCLKLYMKEEDMRYAFPCKKYNDRPYDIINNSKPSTLLCNNGEECVKRNASCVCNCQYIPCSDGSICKEMCDIDNTVINISSEEKDRIKNIINNLRGFSIGCNNDIIENNNAFCYNRCITKITNANFENYLFYKSSNNLLGETEEDRNKTIIEITKKVKEEIKNEIKGNYYIDEEELQNFITKIDVEEIFNSSEIVNSIQVFNVIGPGTISNINIKILGNIFLNKIHNLNVETRSLYDIINDMLKDIESRVVSNTVTDIYAEFEKQKWVFMTAAICLVIIMFLWILTFIKRKSQTNNI